ncbi:MAG: PA2779 family protein [Gammaproteobacteria bacterium]|nr:PA2779 family protein [Gammaproteobacteria bacterium]MDE2250404.1 PA2779 family protein [Gammaproteobacteria bacterium]
MSIRLAAVRTVVGVSLGALVTAGFPLRVHAGMISTRAAIDAAAPAGRAANLERIDAVLARTEVRARLQSLGVNADDAAARAAALPDADLARLARSVDKLPAGGDAGLLELAGFVFLVLLLLDYLDVIHVFSHHRR